MARLRKRLLFGFLALAVFAGQVVADSVQWTVQAVNSDGVVLSKLTPGGAWPTTGQPRFVARWPEGWSGWLVHLGPDGRWSTQPGAKGELDITLESGLAGLHSYWVVFLSPQAPSDTLVTGLPQAGWKTRDALVWLKDAEWRGTPLARGKLRLPLLFSGSYRTGKEVEADSLEVAPSLGWVAVRYDLTL